MQNDFSSGHVKKNILLQALPLMVAQLVSILYNVVDRIYIGHMPADGTIALTGIGLAFPLTTLIAAFTALYSHGASPLFSIARGAGNERQAEHILGQSVMLLLASSFLLFCFCYPLRRPILYLFGASDDSYPFAEEYLRIYLWGTPFVMFSTGLNAFINAEGFPQTGMLTVLLGAVLNLVLDPIFIYLFGMGVTGAAIATVISQAASFLWVLLFFASKKSPYLIHMTDMRPDFALIRSIFSLGISGFIAQGTNSLVQIVCNRTLMQFGGDLYVSAMTVLYSIREVLSLPINSISSGSMPVLGYNFGARKYGLVREGIRFMTIVTLIYNLFGWGVAIAFPGFWFSIFSGDTALIGIGTHALRLYFFGFVFMTFQMAGQSTFVSLRCPARATFFSLFRKVIIVVPLTLLLPRLGLGTDGVFLAEPVSNIIGGLACGLTMYFSLYRKLGTSFVCDSAEQ